MENKDLNTFMNEKLDQGNGLRYKEAYWDDMSKLLDANMPVVQAEVMRTSGLSTKITATGLKLFYLSTAFASMVAVSVLYFKPFSPPSPIHTQKTNITLPEAPLSSPKTQNLTPEVPVTTPLNETQQNTESASDIQNNIPANNEPTQQQHTSSSSPLGTDYTPEASGISDITNHHNKTYEPGDAPMMINKSDEDIIKTIFVNHELIDPISNNMIAHTGLSDNTQTHPLPPKQRGKIIEHIAIIPFAGMVFETGKQSFNSGNSVYTHAAQSNMIYGLNIEAGNKHLALRTGLGLGKTTMETNTTTGQNVYDVDSQYVIVNPNYGTTQSGKPIILIQRQIDSNYLSTTYTTSHQTTTYQYLVVPLTLQYRITHKRLAFVLEGGGLHQFLMSQPKDNNTNLEGKQFTLPSYSFQLTAGSSIRYALSSQWAVGAQYNYNLNPSSAKPQLLNNAHQATILLIWSIR